MILLPKLAVEEGYLSSQDGALPLEDGQIQPNGVDVRLKNIELIGDTSFQLFVGKTKHGSRTQVKKLNMNGTDAFRVFPGRAFNVECYERVDLPCGVAACVYTRSTLNRNGLLVGCGLYDSGFSGPVSFTFYPFSNGILEVGVRVAQVVFFKSEGEELYKGSYGDNAA
ncbi:MAG: hypothetical protein FVQ80_06595 [Planctomycetes bacterium]|nr:hypothetical protein [Planctomycetota bacterium]